MTFGNARTLSESMFKGTHITLLICAVSVVAWTQFGKAQPAAVPQGSAEQARVYYERLARTVVFATPKTILDSTLDDVPRYLGYEGLSARDLEQLSPAVLMDPVRLGLSCGNQTPCETAAQNPDNFRRSFSVLPIRPGEILASRFLAPKIANVSESAETRKIGWRKLVRLRARGNSVANRNGISDGIILFNFFTDPGERPFEPNATSVNTQVMLLTRPPIRRRDTLYWLDYGPLPEGGKLSLSLAAAFDAADLQAADTAMKEYFVPNGCVACHGGDERRPMVNYLDTDHWIDRLSDDFQGVRDQKLPVLFDGGNDPQQPEFARAFDVIRKFNEEAEVQASLAQPNSFHVAAGKNWVRLHLNSSDHIPPVKRGVNGEWRETEQELIGLLNRYCFRCHGTIKFNVFERRQVLDRLGLIASRLKPTEQQLRTNPAFLMPPDRKLPDAERDRMIELLRSMAAQ